MNRRKRTEPAAVPAWRIRTLVVLFALAAGALEARLAWLQLAESERYTAEAEKRQLRTVEMPTHRGVITDRDGEPLGISTPAPSIVVNPKLVPVERDVLVELAAAVGLAVEDVERAITSNQHREFLYLHPTKVRQMSPAAAARVLALEIPGVWADPEYKRFYPAHEVSCHLVGFTNIDDTGIEGLESVFDPVLTGVPGRKLVQKDEKGRVIADVEQIRPARPGQDVRLSIDLTLQYVAYRALKRAVQENQAPSGTIVVLDIETGEVLTMVNQPACNPNNPAERDPELTRNRAVTDPIEAGSTIKPLIFAAALANGYTPETLIDVPKELFVGGSTRSLTSDDSGPLGEVSITHVLAESSSVGAALIGLSLEAEAVWRALDSFGIGRLTGSELRGVESAGMLDPNYLRWGERTLATVSYGYGLSVTPLQLARAYAAIANEGVLLPVSFTALDSPPEGEAAIPQEIAADLLAMLEIVVADGTASRASIPNYRVAGKTGTAKIAEGGSYSDDRYRAVFAGIAPVSRPRFAAAVVINDPRGRAYYGGEIAAPVFAEVIGAALRIYGIAPDALETTSLETDIGPELHAEARR